MRSAGPLWAFALTLDRDLLGALLVVNLAFTGALLRLVFRRRPALDRALIGLGLFCLITGVGLCALHSFAHTPVREVSFFALD